MTEEITWDEATKSSGFVVLETDEQKELELKKQKETELKNKMKELENELNNLNN